jgi:hypothetical protein
MNTTTAYETAVVEGYGNYVAFVLMLSYFTTLTWVAMNWGNRPGAQPWTTIGHIIAPRPSTTGWRRVGEIAAPLPQTVPTGWRRVGEIAFSPNDVNPSILQTSPLYERTYASGKTSQRFWDDVTEEWIYTSGYTTNFISN